MSERITEDARSIHKAVFMDEQGFSQEFDQTDETSLHIVAYDDETPAGVCWIFPNRGNTWPPGPPWHQRAGLLTIAP